MIYSELCCVMQREYRMVSSPGKSPLMPMQTQYGQPPRAKPRLCFGNAYFFAASGNIVLKFRTEEIYEMPNAGLPMWNALNAAVQRGEFYNFAIRHVFHEGGKTIRRWTIPAGWTATF